MKTPKTKSEVLAWLKRKGSPRVAQGMARYGIPAGDAVGIQVGTLRKLAKEIGRDHALAQQLWTSGCYEARLLATMIDDPKLVTKPQMNAWAKDFTSWADCDTACFCLFDRTPHAYALAKQWTKSPREFVKRGGFALMASLALHDKAAEDKQFLPFLPLIEKGARDERNFVKKGVSWALRGIGRRSPALLAESLAVAQRLAKREDAPSRWIGKDALHDLEKVRAKRKAKAAANSG